MNKPQQGVNLGGWLVLEKWIAPSLFEGTHATDEYTLCKELGPVEATKRLAHHRDTFITREHIRAIAKLGLSLVRLPVGYWLFDGPEPFVGGADQYVERLLGWARESGLKVIIDFHAAPGSQNGWDHSGRSGSVRWHEASNMAASLMFVELISRRYGQHPSLVGIELLNEPHWEVPLKELLVYYKSGTELVRQWCHSGVKVIVSDAFRPEQMSKALRKARLDVILDVHLYQLFTPEDRALDLQGHLDKVQREWSKLLQRLTRHHHILVGEWSAAMSELYNELGERQHNYDSEAYQTYAHVQQRLFTHHGVSWTYWTARTEDGRVWSLLDQPHLVLKR